MKYVLVTTAYRPDSGTVSELYIRDVDEWLHTTKLSDAQVWHTFDELAELVQTDHTIHAKIVSVKEKDLFEARLKDE